MMNDGLKKFLDTIAWLVVGIVFFFSVAVILVFLLTTCRDVDHTLEMGDSVSDFECLRGEVQFCDCTNPDADPRVLAVCEENNL